MDTAEQDIEDLARTVVCPVCGARRGRKCRYKNGGLMAYSNYSHTGRLKKARGG